MSDMKIEHFAVYVNDLEKARDFFMKYFEALCGAEYKNPGTGFRSYFLTFPDGPRLEVMSRPQLQDPDKSAARSGYAHLAFSVGSRENVNQLTERLALDGYRVLSGPRVTGDGYYESCVLGPEENQVEITV